MMARKYFMNIQIKLFAAVGFDIDIFSKTTLKSSPLLSFCIMFPTLVYIIPLSSFAVKNVKDINKFTEAMSTLFTGVLCFMKLAHFVYHHKRFVKLIARIRQLLINESQHNLEYDDIVQHENHNDYVLCLISCTVYYATGVGVALFPFLKMGLTFSKTGSTEYILPYPTIFPYDTQMLGKYSFTYLWALVATYSVITFSLAIDTVFSSYTHNVCACFKIAQLQIKSVDPKNIPGTTSLVQHINKIFRLHQDALEISEDLRISFQPLVFAQLLFSSAQICLVAYQSMTKMHEPEIMYLSMFMIAALLQVFAVCYCGERLKSESQAFADAVYCSMWYEFDTKLARSLIIPIARAQRPCMLDGFFFVADLPTFSSILSTALSYITLLNSFKE